MRKNYKTMLSIIIFSIFFGGKNFTKAENRENSNFQNQNEKFYNLKEKIEEIVEKWREYIFLAINNKSENFEKTENLNNNDLLTYKSNIIIFYEEKPKFSTQENFLVSNEKTLSTPSNKSKNEKKNENKIKKEKILEPKPKIKEEDFYFETTPEKIAKIGEKFFYTPKISGASSAVSYSFSCKDLQIYSDPRFDKNAMLGFSHSLSFIPKLEDAGKILNCSVTSESESKKIVQNFDIQIEAPKMDLSIYYPMNTQKFKKNETFEVWASSKIFQEEVDLDQESYIWQIKKDDETTFSLQGKKSSLSLSKSGKYEISLKYIENDSETKSKTIQIEIV